MMHWSRDGGRQGLRTLVGNEPLNVVVLSYPNPEALFTRFWSRFSTTALEPHFSYHNGFLAIARKFSRAMSLRACLHEMS